MKIMKIMIIVAVRWAGRSLLVAFGLYAAALRADNFGSGTNVFSMEFVEITGGSLTKIPEPTTVIRNGVVPRNYRMGKHEVSRAMIGVYNAVSGGPIITLIDMASYGGNGTNKPSTGVSWNQAARFVNWLNVSKGHSPAYKFTTGGANDNIALWTAGDAGFDPGNPFRNTNAVYFLPSEDEWVRAGHFDPGLGIYWDYPTGSMVPNAPTAVTNGTAPHTDVYKLPVATGPANIAEAGGLSAFGTMAQGGNVTEWIESAEIAPNDVASKDRVIRGGIWYLDEFFLRALRQGEPTTYGGGFITFRVASVSSNAAPVLRMYRPRKGEKTMTVDIDSTVGNVDVFRASDVLAPELWSGPILTNLVAKEDVIIDTNTPPAQTTFYLLKARP
jgi:sulfatase modifying factor 1